MTPDEEICSRGRMECTMSLAKAVQEAGGAVSAHLLDMTVAEFIREVAGQNNIQFIFVGPEIKMNPCVMKTMADLLAKYGDPGASTLDIGSFDLSAAGTPGFTAGGCVRRLFTGEYTGLDIVPGPNVDLVVKDPHKWTEIPDNTFEQVVSVCCLEHCLEPWTVVREGYRVLKPGGITIYIVPWSWRIHRFPTDCFRLLPDGLAHLLGAWVGGDVVAVDVCCKEAAGELVYGVGRKPFTTEWIVAASFLDFDYEGCK